MTWGLLFDFSGRCGEKKASLVFNDLQTRGSFFAYLHYLRFRRHGQHGQHWLARRLIGNK